MKISYVDKENKEVVEYVSGFYSYFQVNEKLPKGYMSLDGDNYFRCDEIECSHREKCKKSKLSPDEMLSKCSYLQKLQSLISEYTDKTSDNTCMRYGVLWEKLFGDTNDLSDETKQYIIFDIHHNCKDCKKVNSCNELVNGKGSGHCEFSSKIFELTALGINGIPVWNKDHTRCEAVMQGECAKRYLESQEKQR